MFCFKSHQLEINYKPKKHNLNRCSTIDSRIDLDNLVLMDKIVPLRNGYLPFDI